MQLSEFDSDHPYTDKIGITSLYRFTKIDESHPEYLSHLLIEKKLYHATPDQFNDPFECKPHWNWPKNPNKIREIRKHLIKVARKYGASLKESESLISNFMRNRGKVENSIFYSSHNTFSKVRICIFTTDKNNLLFWSHYADSHKGFCIEFDATMMPIKGALKVKYQSDYPEIEYPAPKDRRNLSPLLTKSKEWEYEQEFRTILVPLLESQPKNDGESLILNGNEIKSIYFGANIKNAHKEKIFDMINNGPFSPEIYDTVLSKSSYHLEFVPYSY